MSIGSGRLAGLSRALVSLGLASPGLVLSVVVVSCADVPNRRRPQPQLAALGPEIAIGEPAGGYAGKLDVSPVHAPAGTQVTLTAERLPPGQEFQLVWTTAIGTWKVADAEYHGRDFSPVAYEIARAKTDAAGRLTVNFIAPDDYGFMHDIVLQQGSRLFTKVAFNLDMTVEISPKSGRPARRSKSTSKASVIARSTIPGMWLR